MFLLKCNLAVAAEGGVRCVAIPFPTLTLPLYVDNWYTTLGVVTRPQAH